MNQPTNILGLDVGEKRIGVAMANLLSRLPAPFTTLENDSSFAAKLNQLIDDNAVSLIVVGLPRNLSGDDTRQTAAVRQFVENLKNTVKIPLVFQDEAVTSLKAEAELKGRRGNYTRADIDALSAAYILDDYLKDSRA